MYVVHTSAYHKILIVGRSDFRTCVGTKESPTNAEHYDTRQ